VFLLAPPHTTPRPQPKRPDATPSNRKCGRSNVQPTPPTRRPNHGSRDARVNVVSSQMRAPLRPYARHRRRKCEGRGRRAPRPDATLRTDDHPRCAEAADRGTPAFRYAEVDAGEQSHRNPETRKAVVPPAGVVLGISRGCARPAAAQGGFRDCQCPFTSSRMSHSICRGSPSDRQRGIRVAAQLL
jgi:hypothetical protein